MPRTTQALTLSLTLLISGAAVFAFADDTTIKLQGKGARRDALAAMSYKPFDFASFGKLDGWTGGAAPTKDSAKGKPVLIVAWASWYKISYSALIEAQKMADKNKDLIVVGAHHKTRPNGAADVLTANKITFANAHDSATGEFFSALKIEYSGPNYYIIDRAGNLRFADLDKSSLDEAVKIVVAESPEDAAKAEGRAKEAEKAKGDTPLSGPDVTGGAAKPESEAFKTAAWPKTNKGVEYAKNVQGKPLPVALGKETWITPKPDLAGKVIVLDFWATWCGPCVAASPMLDELQEKHKDELVVIGISGQASHGKAEDVPSIKAYLKTKKSSYSHANDLGQGVYKSLGITAIPHVVVMSSDGVVRWQGNPHDPEFVATVEKVMKADPWVQNRTKAKKG